MLRRQPKLTGKFLLVKIFSLVCLKGNFMDINEVLLRMVSHKLLTLEDANIVLRDFKDSILKKYVELQYIPGASGGIEIDVNQQLLRLLFQRVRTQWINLGDTEPYVSVLSTEKFLMKNIDENLAEFQKSGEVEPSRLERLSAKNGVNINYRNCLELGCGVGRMTAHLASKFEKVIGYDISNGNLAIAKKYISDLKINNVDLYLIESLESFNIDEKIDAFLSFMVLQHNPPPLQKYFLERTLEKLRPGGVFYFQTVTHAPSYSYTVTGNFNYPTDTQSEMHCLPIAEIFRILHKNNLLVLDVIKDGGSDNHDSNSFFGIRPY